MSQARKGSSCLVSERNAEVSEATGLSLGVWTVEGTGKAPAAALKTLGTHQCPSGPEGGRAGRGETGKSRRTLPPTGPWENKWMEAESWQHAPMGTHRGMREGEGDPKRASQRLNYQGTRRDSPVTLVTWSHPRKSVRHPAAVPDADWGGDIAVQQDLSAHHGEVHRHLLCALPLSLLPGHPTDWVRWAVPASLG